MGGNLSIPLRAKQVLYTAFRFLQSGGVKQKTDGDDEEIESSQVTGGSMEGECVDRNKKKKTKLSKHGALQRLLLCLILVLLWFTLPHPSMPSLSIPSLSISPPSLPSFPSFPSFQKFLSASGKTYSNIGYDFDPRWYTHNITWAELKSFLRIHNQSKTWSKENEVILLPRTVKKPVKKKGTGQRSFGCLRDGCRGLAIEDMLDRGWSMRFKSSYKNGTKEFKDINYHITFLLTDTTALNQIKSLREDLFNKVMYDYSGSSYVTAFMGAEGIGGNKGKQLREKARLATRFKCKYNDLGIQPPQYRLYVKDECEDLIKLGTENPELTWLLKPEEGSQGQGITFHSEVDEIEAKRPEFFPCRQQLEIPAPKRALVQSYIEEPLLLKGTKFDVRVYMLIARSEPWFVFYHEGYLRRSLSKYSALSKDRKVYLTNTHFQSMKKGFKLSEHIWSFETFQEYLSQQKITSSHYVETNLNPYIKQVAFYVFMSAKKKLIPRDGSYHIIGLDFMIDSKFGVHFIEGNGYPGFTWSINFDSRGMVEETIDLVQELHEAPSALRLMRAGDRYASWEMIHSDVDAKARGRRYNPCEEFRINFAKFAPMRKANKKLARISGPHGSTKEFDDESSVSKRLPNWEMIGGEKGKSLTTRVSYGGEKCDYWSLKLEPKSYRLYHVGDCNKLFQQSRESEWIVKQVQGKGLADGLVYFSSTKDLKNQFYPCKDMADNWIAQQRVRSPLRLEVDRIMHPGKPRDELRLDPNERRREPSDGGLRDEDKGAESLVAPPFDEQLVQYDLRAYMLVSSIDPLMVWYHDGYLRSVRPAVYNGYYGFKLDEHAITFDQFEFYLAASQMTGAHYLSSVLRPYISKVMEYVALSARSQITNSSSTKAHCQLFALNFVIDEFFRLSLVGVSGDDSHGGFFSKHQNVQSTLESMKQTMRELVLEVKTAPIAFTRMRRGDTFGNFSLVFSEIEEFQYGRRHDPCTEISFGVKNKRMYVTKDHLAKVANLQNFIEKQHASHLREMKKYVGKRWDYCKYKQTKELQASCIRNTISLRYKIFIQKERIPYQPGYVENKIRELQASHRPGQVPQWKLQPGD